jgi:hypothetical protein
MSKSLSEHFSLEELILSQTAARQSIDNMPSAAIIQTLRKLAAALEDVRSLLGGVPMLVSSGYRCPELNEAVGGAKNSAHMDGLAADFTAPAFGAVIQVARKIAASHIAYDQLIHEYAAWVHLGLAKDGVEPRRQNLSIFKGTGYLDGIVGKPS